MYPKGNNIYRILALFRGDYSLRLYLREISRLANLSLKSTHKALSFLESKRILKSSFEGRNKYFSINLENIHTKHYVQRTEIFMSSLFLEEYPEFKIFFKSVLSNSPIILFGSFAKFNAYKDSDIDLLIITNKEDIINTELLPNPPHIIEMNEKTFFKALNKHEELIKEIQENHIIINNHSFFVNAFWAYYEKEKKYK